MVEEKRRVKRQAVSEETRRGHHRAAVNPNARGTSSRREGGEEPRRIRRGQ